MAAVPLLVVESTKNRVLVYEDRVVKEFRSGRGIEKKAQREIAALRRLAGLDGVPAILAQAPDGRSLTLSRLPGKPLSECESIAEGSIARLRELVERILARGVARHHLPARDVIVAPDGSVGLVDFERSTRRRFPGDPSFLVARGITRFHLMRLVHEYAPQLLTPRETRRMRRQVSIRNALQRPLKLKRRLLRSLGLRTT